ncbi:MAG: hypothetical protein IPK16_10105 [Anaerolineales bacterium]|nr:hypothetical protein [Anaerolineales bacterium]
MATASWFEREQADYLAKMMETQNAAGVAGELVWTLYDFTVPLPEYRFWQKAVQAHMGILTSDGVPKRAVQSFTSPQ